MIRRLVLVLAAAAALVAAPHPARAETDVGFAFYEKTAVTILKSAGAKIWGAADDARKNGLFQFAAEQAERALEFDPNLQEARDYLGFVKKDGKWVPDPEATAKVQRQNVRPSNRSDESQAALQKKWEDESLKAADKFCSKLYADLGDACAAKGYKDQAEKGYSASLRLDKDNEKARKGLGYTKFGKTWLTKKQDDARKAASKSVEIKDPQKSRWEEFFETKLTKVESAHFRIESTFPAEELHGHCLAAESAYAYYLADFTRDPGDDVFEGGKMLFMIVGTEAQWNKAVDAYGGNEKDFTRQLGGFSISGMQRVIRGGVPESKSKGPDGKEQVSLGSTLESRRDHLVHVAVHELNHRVWKLANRAWLDEGLTYYYSLKVLESCLTHCVALKRGDYANGHVDEGGLKKWDDPGNWKPLLKDLVRKKDDAALRSVTLLPLTKLEFFDSVKAWGVASWLMDLDRDKFIKALDQMLDPNAKQDMVFQGVYGKSYEELDDDWHRFALKAY